MERWGEEQRKMLQQVLRDVFLDDEIVIDSHTVLKDLEGYDSVAYMTLIAQLENEFRVHFSLQQIVELKTVGELLDIIGRKIE